MHFFLSSGSASAALSRCLSPTFYPPFMPLLPSSGKVAPTTVLLVIPHCIGLRYASTMLTVAAAAAINAPLFVLLPLLSLQAQSPSWWKQQ